MTKNNTPYGSDFYEQQQEISLSSAREVVPYLLSILPVQSVCDPGCGVGTWLAAFRELGVEETLGIDGDYVSRDQLRIPADCFVPADLTEDWLPESVQERRFDLAISVGVAEHLPQSSARSFVRRLTQLSDLVLFSAALPKQGGTNHVNEQWPSYWIDIFADYGFQRIDCMRAPFWRNQRIDLCYRNNMFVFADSSALECFPKLGALSVSCRGTVADIVHPERYEMIVRYSDEERLYLSLVLRKLPHLVLRAVERKLWPMARRSAE